MYARKFTLQHTFDEISEMFGENGPVETHFGVPWHIGIERNAAEPGREESLSIFLNYNKDADWENPWSVSFNATYRIENRSENYKIEDSLEDCLDADVDREFAKECDWETLVEKFIEDDKLTVEIDVVITEMKGFVPKRKRNFDAPEEHLTDVVLLVGDRKFHVSKVVLAEFSDYFAPLFLNGCKESRQSEITLKEVDPDIFQLLLEVIYGDLECIQESTVEDLLVLARKFQVKVVTQKCVNFLMKKVDLLDQEIMDLDLDMKFRLASTFNLLDLQDHLLRDINSKKDSNKRLARSVKDMSDSFIAKLIHKIYE